MRRLLKLVRNVTLAGAVLCVGLIGDRADALTGGLGWSVGGATQCNATPVGSLIGSTDDGGGQDSYVVQWTDANGRVIETVAGSVAVGQSTSVTLTVPSFDGSGQLAGPLPWALRTYDTPGGTPGNGVFIGQSLAGSSSFSSGACSGLVSAATMRFGTTTGAISGGVVSGNITVPITFTLPVSISALRAIRSSGSTAGVSLTNASITSINTAPGAAITGGDFATEFLMQLAIPSNRTGQVRVVFLQHATYTQAGANSGTAVLSYNLDTRPPSAPTGLTITAPASGSTQHTISGQAEARSSITITLPSGSTVTTSADANGNFSTTANLVGQTGNITVTATDAAGNVSPAASVTFDAQAPSAPTLTVTLPTSGSTLHTISGQAEASSTVTISLPNGATLTTTADANGNFSATSNLTGLSGNVTATAVDAAGNVSPPGSVTINFALPGVTLSGGPASVMAGEAFSVTATFETAMTGLQASEVNAANATATAVTGSGTVFTIALMATGSGDVTVQIPAGVANDAFGNANTASNVLTIADTTAQKTGEDIAKAIYARASQTVNLQPNINRFVRGPSGGAFDVFVTRGNVELNFTSRNRTDGLPIWFELKGSRTDDGADTSSYILGSVGAHSWVSSNLLVGGMLQIDNFEQTSGASTVEGTGWLAGPYVTTKASDYPLYFDARVLYGQTSNSISPFGTYKDDFDTERWLIDVNLTGSFHTGRTNWLPHLGFSHIEDTQSSYTDSLGNMISENSVTVRNATLGLSFEHLLRDDDKRVLLTGGLSAINSSTEGTGAAANVVPTFDGTRGRAEFGLGVFDENFQFRGDVFLDGIGTKSFESYGISLSAEFRF